jgi:hypothetical protein
MIDFRGRPMLAFKPKLPTCSICNEPVELETTKFDEAEKLIHEERYVLKGLRKAMTASVTAREGYPTQ